jgi:hypothetical protein
MSLLSDLSTEWERLTTLVAQQELLVFLNAGGIQEVRFPDHTVAPRWAPGSASAFNAIIRGSSTGPV